MAGRTRFRNVDLIIRSRRDLRPLAEAFGPRVCVLFAGRESRVQHKLCLELSAEPKSPDGVMVSFCRLVERLSPAARKLWDGAGVRVFSFAVDAGQDSASFALRASTIRAVAALHGTLEFVVYSTATLNDT